MEITDTNIIISKFKTLQAKEDVIFDIGKLKDKGWHKEEAFLNFGYRSFYDNLENEIKSLPKSQQTINKIDEWINKNNANIRLLEEKIKTISRKITYPTSPIFLTYRKKLNVKLYEIKEALVKDECTIPVQPKISQPIEQDTLSNKDTLPHLNLSDFFEIDTKYNDIMNLLVEKGKCQPITFIWKDNNNGNKGLLAALIKHLHKQGYYKNNKCPTNDQIKEIALYPFGCKIGIDTIKRAQPEQFEFDLNFIPPALS